MLQLYTALLVASSAAVSLGVLALWTALRAGRRRSAPPAAPAVTVLKPLCGADDALEENLESFFVQDYPRYELLFGVEGREDPAIDVVRRLRERYPNVTARLVIHNGGRGLNPKVSNLSAMLEVPTADVLVISDSNVRVDPDYLDEAVGQLSDQNVGLVTHLIAGVGEERLGALFENTHLAGTIAASVAGSRVLGGNTATVGKSLVFRRSHLERLGGLASVSHVLAEDYVLGRMFRTAGWDVRLSSRVIRNVCKRATVRTFWHRHVRWGAMRSRLLPWLYPFEILLNPMGLAALAPLFGITSAWVLVWAVLLTAIRDGLQWYRLRGRHGMLEAIFAGPVKDVMAAAVWLVAPFIKYVAWRGRRYRMSSGTRLYAQVPVVSPTPIECEV